MGLSSFFTSTWESFSHPSPDAEEPPKGGASTQTPASGTDEESGAEKDVNVKDAKTGGGEGATGHVPGTDKDEKAVAQKEEEEEEEEEEEVKDPKEGLEEGEFFSIYGAGEV